MFINCPFDDEYKENLRVIIFTVIHCKFNPLISETKDSGANRLDSIIKLMKSSRLSIHDLSRNVSKKAGEAMRFNMPLELGIDLGLKNSEKIDLKDKVSMVIDVTGKDKNQYFYQKSISDLAGNDLIIYTQSELISLVEAVRNFLYIQKVDEAPDQHTNIWDDYNMFKAEYIENLEIDKLTINRVIQSEYIDIVQGYLDNKSK